MIKKVFLSFVAIIFIFTSTSFILPGNANQVQASTCKNPYTGYLVKYNPCLTHTEINYVYVKKNTAGTPIALTAAGVTTTSANKALTFLGLRTIPYVSGIVWASDALSVGNHYLNQYWQKRGIKRFKVTYKWKYKLDPLADGGGIPKPNVISTSVQAEY